MVRLRDPQRDLSPFPLPIEQWLLLSILFFTSTIALQRRKGGVSSVLFKYVLGPQTLTQASKMVSWERSELARVASRSAAVMNRAAFWVPVCI